MKEKEIVTITTKSFDGIEFCFQARKITKNFAIHKNKNRYSFKWVISHIDTGIAAVYAKSEFNAMLLANICETVIQISPFSITHNEYWKELKDMKKFSDTHKDLFAFVDTLRERFSNFSEYGKDYVVV